MVCGGYTGRIFVGEELEFKFASSTEIGRVYRITDEYTVTLTDREFKNGKSVL